MIEVITSSPQTLLDAATVVIPQTAYNTAASAAEVPSGAYNYVNDLFGWDIGTTILGAGMMATAALTDVVPYIGNVDDPLLYPGGAAFLHQASQNKPIPEAAETILIDGIGGAIRRIVPGVDYVVPEKTTDPSAYLGFGLLAGVIATGAAVVALKMTDVI